MHSSVRKNTHFLASLQWGTAIAIETGIAIGVDFLLCCSLTLLLQHIIYLLCRTQALLMPSYAELQHLAALIGNVYLKSSHCFIRIAALQGLLCLLECCSRTNTAMGKLSDELSLLRDLIVGYINRHGIIDER